MLGHWQYIYLDQDGGTKKIEEKLEAYVDIFGDMLKEDATKAISKYGHLAPPDYLSRLPQIRLEPWESKWLNGNQKYRRTLAGLHEKILDSRDVFYEHNNQDLTLNGGKLTSTDDPKQFVKEAKEKYGYLALVPRHGWSPWVHCENRFLDTLFGGSTDENDHVPPHPPHSRAAMPPSSPQVPTAHRARRAIINCIAAMVAFAAYLVVEFALCHQAWMNWESWMSDGRVAADEWGRPIAR